MKILNNKAVPIKIADKIRPFSHLPGTKLPLPFSEKGIQVFPSALRILPENKLIPLNISGPVKNFTSVLDLEKGIITVFGNAASGYFRYHIFAREDEICFFQDRGNPVLSESAPLVSVEKLPASKKFEKFSLGSNKTLDWELVKRRQALEEILPVWYRLGQMVKCPFEHGSPSLLQDLVQSSGLPTTQHFLNLFHAGFSGILYPELQEHLGFNHSPIGEDLSNIVEGFNKIRSLLIVESESKCAILPEILLYFPHGKITGLQTSFGEIDIEWTKNHIRQMVIRSKSQSKVHFLFPKRHVSCRLKTADLQLSLSLNCTIDLRTDTHYFLSHFQE